MTAIRPGDARDLPFFEAMLFEAFFWDAASPRPAFAEFRESVEFRKLLAGWGRAGDRALVAETDGAPASAAWFRLWTPELHSYGFVDARTPELAIAVAAGRRGQGIGHALLDALVETARVGGFPALSLSVSPENPARGLYESAGFRRVGESGTSWTLALALEPAAVPRG